MTASVLDRPADPDPGPGAEVDVQGRSSLIHRGILAAFVALATFRFKVLSGGIIAGEVDPSWWIGLGWMRSEHLDFGTDTVFTYGPLGLLAEPSWASSRLWLALALLASAATAGWFGWVVTRAVRLDVNRGWAIVSAAGLGLLTGWTLDLTEVAALAMAVDVYTRLPSTTDAPPRRRALTAFAVVVGLLVLTKLSTAVIAAAALAVLALAWGSGRRRARRLVEVGAIALATTLVGWLVTGNELGGLAPWAKGSLDLTRTYGTGMVANALSDRWNDRALLVVGVLLVGVVVTQVRRARDVGLRRLLPEVALVALMSWFALKAGLVRFDRPHLSHSLLHLSTWIVLPSMRLRWRALPLAALVLVGTVLTASQADGHLRDLDTLRTERQGQPGQVMDAVHAIVDGGVHERRAELAKADLRAFYAYQGLTATPVVAALEGRRVAADGWDIAALWAYDLDWAPLGTLQSYAALSPWLDERNADRVGDAADGPDAVLWRDRAIDDQWPPWSTPATELAVTCSFETVATGGEWSALHRAPSVCGAPRRIGEVDAAPGETIEVPTAGPDELVIATFEIDQSLGKRAVDLVGRDPTLSAVEINGRWWKYVPTTAGSPHLMSRPDRVGDRDLPGQAVALEQFRFIHLGGSVRATFYAVPLG